MRFSILLTVFGVIALIFGLAFFIVPVQALAQYNATTGPVGYIMVRFFGATLIEVGLVFLLMRSVQDPLLTRGIAAAAVLGGLVGLQVALHAVRNNVVNALGWSSVAIYAVQTLAFGWFIFKPARAT